MKTVSYEYVSTDGKYRAVFPDNVMESIFVYCARVGPRETGGILVGLYTNDQSTAIVTEATPPPRDSKSGSTWFHRGVAGLRSLLEKYWKNPKRQYYLGEWHFHPAVDVEPSHVDISQMTRISLDRRYNCPEPISLIVGEVREGKRSTRLIVFPRNSTAVELFPAILLREIIDRDPQVLGRVTGF